MPSYRAPIDDMLFLLRDVFDTPSRFANLPGCADATDDVMAAILEEAGKFCENELSPINRIGDETGTRFEAGEVVTAPGLREAYENFVGGGWPALSLPPEYGGQGLPKTLQFLVDEMIAGANISFGLFPGLTRGAVEAIEAHASPELKAIWLPRMVSGEWTGAMDLTEPQAGSDLGVVRTKAEPLGNGRYAITGTKIFITAGDHDLASNIVHLVLVRLPDAAPGTKGISLVLVPKRLLDESGELGERNHVTCGSIEHKMGIKASPTCVMNFDGATGWLLGEPGKGLAAMFTMMNAERLMVGVQGIGIAEAAYQGAAAYAKERIQGRDLETGGPAHILAHADVRRNLLTARAWAEGMRALAVWTALQLDTSLHHPDPAERKRADDLVALITPVIKAASTDLGLEAAIAAQQVFGGHGYIREWGVEQLVRDVRITQLYEGTNGIQAMDLVGRKLQQGGGALPRAFFAMIEASLADIADDPALAFCRDGLARLLGRARHTTESLMVMAKADPHAAGAGATDFLRLLALTGQGWMWTEMFQAALKRPENDPLRAIKPALAEFFFARLAPQAEALAVSVLAGSRPVMSLPANLF